MNKNQSKSEKSKWASWHLTNVHKIVRTDEISNVESLVIGPKGVVYAWVPAFVGSNNVVGGGDGGDRE